MYDVFGNYIGGEGGYETEEERRKRLEEEAAAATPVTQTIKTNPVTGQQEMTIKGTPQDLSASNPLTPTVSAPVDPNELFRRQQMVESGNRDFDAQGRPITSPAGAMFKSQVMPATAANPGFGIKPAASQTPEEYNRVGQEYSRAMQQRYPNDQQAQIAAYNMGPGAVDQNIKQNNGRFNLTQAPKETQGYVPKVLGQVLNAIVPSAQAAPAPQTAPAQGPVNPAAQAQAIQNKQGLNFSDANIPAPQTAPAAPVNPAAPAPAVEQAGPSTTAMTPESWAERLNTARQDDRQLASLAYDPNTPQYIREEASGELYKKLKNAQSESAANAKFKQAVEKGDMRDVDREIKKGTEEGSWLKYLLYGFIDPNMARNERMKLFPEEGSKWMDFTSPDGKENGFIQIGQNGLPIKGKTADGRLLTEKELVNYSQGVGKGEHFETGLVDNNTSIGGYTRSVVNGRPVVRDANNRLVTDPAIITNLRKVGVEGTQAEQMDAAREKAALSNLKSRIANPTSEQIYQAYRNAGVSPKRIESVMGLAPGTLTAQGGGGSAVATPTRTENAPSNVRAADAAQSAAPSAYEQPEQRAGESNDAFKARTRSWETKQKLLIKDAESFREKQTNIKQQLETLREGLDIIESGNYNLGPLLGSPTQEGKGAGALPGVQEFFGGLVGTQDSINTGKIRSLITKEGLQGIKDSMGPSISNFDVQAWLKANPVTEKSSPAAMKDYINKLYRTLYNHAEESKKNAVELGLVDPNLDLGPKPGAKEGKDEIKIIKREKI
jgi:soluble lytic murein transglycosylase